MGFDQLTLSILSSIPDPLVVIDQNQCVLLLNPAAEHVFNIPANTARGRSVQEIIQSDDLMLLVENKNKGNAEWTTADNKAFVPRTEPIRDQDGNLEGWV